ncbi:hypothetical protein ABPG75_009042 [Micractinium tetrahymenae]
MARRSLLPLATLLVALLTAPGPCWCLVQELHGPLGQQQEQQQGEQRWQPADGGRALLQAAGDADPQAAAQAAADGHKYDITVEEAILQTYEPPSDRRAQQQQQQAGQAGEQQQQQQQHPDAARQQGHAQQQQQAQQARRLREDKEALARAAQAKAAQEADHSRQLERQRREAAQVRERLAARQQEERQQQSLGRGSLRTRKPPAARQPAVSGSNKNDIFAQHTERHLAAARERFAEQRATLAAARAAQGQQQGQQQGRQQHAGDAAGQRHIQVPAAHKSAPGPRRRHQSIPLPIIVVMTLVMAAAAGLGALPFFFVRSMSPGATGAATAIACGVMLAASFDLVHDGQPYGAALTVAGVLLGGWFIKWVQERLAAYEDISFGSLQGSSARKTVLMVGIMAAHALGEGCAVGVSFCGERGWAQGVLTTLAIGVHNIPEGLAKATVLVGQGVSPRRALAWSVATCLPQPLVAIPSFMFVDAFAMILPVALGFAAGCMIWMVFAELLPDALERAEGAQVATAATAAAAGLEGFRMFFSSLEQADGSLGAGAAAAHAAGALGRMGPPLLVLLPAVAAAAGGGAALGNSAVPAPVAWGVAAAVALSSGGGTIVDQLLFRTQLPAVHTLAAAAAGAVLALLLHRQLLAWADASAAGLAARKLRAMEKAGGAAGAAGRSASDIEDVELASLYQQHHLHHHPTKMQHHPHTHPLPLPLDAGGADGPHYAGTTAGMSNGYGGSSSSLHLQAPYHRGGIALSGNGSTAALAGGLSSGAATPSGFGLGGAATPLPRGGWRAMRLLPAGQLAAASLAAAALAAGALATGWHLACTLLLLGTDRSAALLPAAALLLAGPGLGAGALARALPSRSGASAGAWLGGALAGIAALAASVAAARAHESAHTATLVQHFFYPYGVTDTAEALAGGALCAAGCFALAAGSAIKPGSARGGLVLGLLVTGLLAGLRLALCSFTPYCLSVHALLQQAR